MKKTILLVCMFVLVAGMNQINAQENRDSEKYQKNTPETYVAPMGIQFVRGIVNAGTGWGEIPRQIALSAQDDGALLCVPYGLPSGIFMTVVRTFYGAMETAFFYIPFNDHYTSAMNPAYVWQARNKEENKEIKE